MRKTLAFALTAIGLALAGCSGKGAAIDHSLAVRRALARQVPAHPNALTCAYVRAHAGPPGPPPGIPQAGPPASHYRVIVERWLRTHCDSVPPRSAPSSAPAGIVPPHPGAGFQSAAAFYPPTAQRLGVEGDALVRVCIGPHGHVRSASIARSSGSATLDRAALRYARATSGRWVPAKRRGQPVSGCTTMSARFSMVGGL